MGLAQYYDINESVVGMTRKLTSQEVKLQKEFMEKKKVKKIVSKYDNTKYCDKKYEVVVV